MKNYYWLKRVFVAGILLYGIALATVKAETDSSENKAPERVISEWINSTGLTLAYLHGKVVIID